MWKITFHVHRNILSSHCHIQYHDKITNIIPDSLKVECTEKELYFSIVGKNVQQNQIKIKTPLKLFKPLSLTAFADTDDNEKGSTPNVQNGEENSLKKSVNEDGFSLSFTFRLEISDSSLLQMVQDNFVRIETVLDFAMKSIKLTEPYYLICTFCESPLFHDPMTFTKIIECNEGLVSELAENWFCHGTPKQSLQFLPQALYVDNMSFYLPQTVSESLDCSEDIGHKCRGCGAVVCQPVSSMLRFYSDKINFKSELSSKVNLTEYRFMMAMRSLWSILESSRRNSFCSKIYLQSKTKEKDNCLLMWISSEKIDQYYHCSSVEVNLDFKTKPTYKVLYHYAAPSSKHVQVWRHDFSVDFHKVSDSIMTTIVTYLKRTSEYIPGGQVKVDGFSTGCLPAHSDFQSF